MKRKITIILLCLSLLNLFCSGMEITEDNVRNELRLAADSIKKDKNSIYKLDEMTIGNRGYFYIIRNNGTISYHPKKALINFDFSRYPFVRKILKERNGCLSFNADGTQRYVFFSEIDSEEILCLAIDSIEFSDTVYKCDSDIEEKR
jgi:hypothetical protein